LSLDFSKLTEQQVIDMMYPAQKEAYLECRYGKGDVLITSEAGFGKSFIIDALGYYADADTIITGTSGIAATNVDGMTTHRTLSIPVGIPTKKDLSKVGSCYRGIFKKGHPVKNIIIDEFPMFGVDALEGLIERRQRASKTSKHKRVRLLLFGDFFQIPSPTPRKTVKMLKERYGTTKMINSEMYKSLDLKVFELDQNKRSGDDKVFSCHLSNLREGKDLDNVLEYLNQYVREPDQNAVYLTPHNVTADKINQEVFDKNPNPVYRYQAKVTGKFPERDRKLPDVIELKEGLRVRSTFNDTSEESLFVNGSCGVILNLFEDCVEVKFDNGNTCLIEPQMQENKEYFTNKEDELESKVVGRFAQIGLKQCSAVSIHACQGLTLDKVAIDLSKGAFEYGQVYVAVSRLRKVEGLYLKVPIQKSDILVDEDVKKYYASIRGEEYVPDMNQGLTDKQKQFKLRLIVAGGRDFKDSTYAYQALDFMLKNYNKGDVMILDGGATGADRVGREYAISRNIYFETFEADWKDLTKRPCKIKSNSYGEYNCLAGLNRNKNMGDIATHAVVFWDGKSTGSEHMKSYMEELGKPVKVFKY
jgi:hypothetical protein